ncbi:ExbD/TolR family protein [Allohahella sp. A8]|uniref:ExbD/TolR family protein n=1 Tax=Allohahella sp. A8 TaxID=3141461 RepID=UPI000C08E64C|nr:biopolymer transporter ExbD [Hahellaceae bacterium]
MKFKRQHKEELSVNLTPLIDIVFLLLIFFMVSTTFTKESRLQIDLPKASSDPVAAETTQLEVVIDPQGKYRVNDRLLVNSQLNTLKRAVEQLSEGNSSLPFIITADAQTPHEFVVRAMDAAGQLGFSKLSITTAAQAPEDDAAGVDGGADAQ